MIEKAAILSTGDELTTGIIVDTNANYLCDKLSEAGLNVAAIIAVGDVPERLEWAWRRAIEIADVVVSTGGLGPTADDLTTETLARIAGVKLWRDEPTVERMTQLFKLMNRPMPENNLRQAMFPDGAVIIPNPLGTAPGFRMPITLGGHTAHLIVMPGVPREMKPMMENAVLPWIAANRGTDTVYASRTFQTFGMSESALDAAVAGVIAPEEGKVSFRASFPKISVRVRAAGKPGEAERKAHELGDRMLAKISDYVYAEGDSSMEEIVARLFIEKQLTLAVAESCTGGMIGDRITDVPGSSRFFKADFVTYSNDVKSGVLGVSEATLKTHGAVSEECVREMAAGARAKANADVAIATSGIAGPDGGTPDKPVGTVCIALASAEKNISRRYQLRSTREWIKLLTSQIALDWLRRFALDLPIGDAPLFRR
ncbi:MAG: competence/damage-inducible protein A [Candidatus Binataceae bacterium]